MRYFIVFLVAALACSSARGVSAQEFDANLLDTAGVDRTYLLQLSGTVFHESFTNVKASLMISNAPPGSPHKYLVVIEGFPQKQMRNSFYWISEESTMEVYANQIVCSIRNAAAKKPDIHFFYVSPVILEPESYTHKDKQDRQRILRTVNPIAIFAQAGELTLTINTLTVSGTVWLKGYDSIQKSYVLYKASFSGIRESRVEQTLQ